MPRSIARPAIIWSSPTRSSDHALGDSGTNFKTAPAIGKCLAEWIVDGSPRTVDLRPFRSSRFADRELLVGAHEYGDEPMNVFR